MSSRNATASLQSTVALTFRQGIAFTWSRAKARPCEPVRLGKQGVWDLRSCGCNACPHSSHLLRLEIRASFWKRMLSKNGSASNARAPYYLGTLRCIGCLSSYPVRPASSRGRHAPRPANSSRAEQREEANIPGNKACFATNTAYRRGVLDGYRHRRRPGRTRGHDRSR